MSNRKESGRRRATPSKSDDIPTKRRRHVFSIPAPQMNTIPGRVLVCGQGDVGQLGLGDISACLERKRPTLVPTLENIVDVRAGGMHNLCLDKDGDIYSFGCNDEGALGRDCSEEGSDRIPKKIELPGKCIKISAGDSHSACLLEDGRVLAWGSFRDSHGAMGLTLAGNQNYPIEIIPNITAVDIASGADHLVVLTNSGEVYTMGCGEQGQLGRVTIRSSSGEGRRGKTELLNPGLVALRNRRPRIDAIWASVYGTFVREHGTSTIWAFGLNNWNQLGCDTPSLVAAQPVDTDFQDVSMIAGGQHHTIVLKNDKNCYAVGRSDYGRLGLENITEEVVKELRLIETLTNKNVATISRGEAQSFAVTENGELYVWGMGTNQQLGTGNDSDVLVPTILTSKQTQGKKIIQAFGGGQHTIFLVADKNQNVEKEVTTNATTEGSGVLNNVKVNGDATEPLPEDDKSSETSASTTKKGKKKN